MHVFVTGGSGLTGPVVVAELIAAGHTVTGLARSDDAAASSARTQALLGWAPTHATLLEDMETGDYFAVQAA